VNTRGVLRGIGGIIIFLLCWEVLVRSGVAAYEYLPAPSAIAGSLPEMLGDRDVLGEIGHTVIAALIGWTIAVTIGVFLGAALGLSRNVRDYALASVDLLRPIPSVALVPVSMLLFGFSMQTELLVIVIPSIWPILINTMSGVLAVPGRLQDVGKTLHLARFAVITKIFIPAAAPSVLVGCRLSMTTALVLAIVSEMIGNPAGVGYAVVREAQALQPDVMFVYVIITGLLGIVFNAALMALSAWILPGEFKRPQAMRGMT
jgi:ABC-type nitrate/sulfonate/bicarbonate transport system permease component